jgi:AcrR family transcriptional regulator
MSTSSLRVYGGVGGDHRRDERRTQLIEAGLDLLGGVEEPALTVRGVCQHASLATRYFYESFDDRDALTIAIFEHVVSGLTESTLAAVAAAPADAVAKVRAGLGQIVRTIADDPRRGRLLFSSSIGGKLLADRRLESARTYASLLTAQAREFYGAPTDVRMDVTAQFLVGGLAQTLTGWLNGELAIGQPEIVEHCAGIFMAVSVRGHNLIT